MAGRGKILRLRVISGVIRRIVISRFIERQGIIVGGTLLCFSGGIFTNLGNKSTLDGMRSLGSSLELLEHWTVVEAVLFATEVAVRRRSDFGRGPVFLKFMNRKGLLGPMGANGQE